MRSDSPWYLLQSILCSYCIPRCRPDLRQQDHRPGPSGKRDRDCGWTHCGTGPAGSERGGGPIELDLNDQNGINHVKLGAANAGSDLEGARGLQVVSHRCPNQFSGVASRSVLMRPAFVVLMIGVLMCLFFNGVAVGQVGTHRTRQGEGKHMPASRYWSSILLEEDHRPRYDPGGRPKPWRPRENSR